MKIILCLLVFVSALSFGQISGELANSGRKYNEDFQFQVEGHKAGYFVFEMGVDMDGVIKICQLIQAESNLVNTPLMVKAKNHILTNLKFERGYQFPKLHSGKIKITIVLPVSTK